MSLATPLHGGISGSFRLQVLFSTTVPMGRASASARLMPCDEPDASTTTSKACAQALKGLNASRIEMAALAPSRRDGIA